jgi:hypothetical protein
MKNIYNRNIILALLILLLMFSQQLFSQSNATIENIDFYAEENSLVIKYDIVKALNSELFEIWVKVITESGKTIVPKSTNGDIGAGVAAGPNKRIVWDLSADNITIDEAFTVEVFARSDYKEPKVVKPKREGISVGGAVLLSAILPGLGKTVAKGGGTQWMWGVIGYGCVAGSVVMNNKAFDTYEEYKIADHPDDRDDHFSKAEEYDLYSKIFIGTAATIWIIDLISTASQVSKINKRKNKSSYSIHYTVDPISRRPLLGVTLRF